MLYRHLYVSFLGHLTLKKRKERGGGRGREGGIIDDGGSVALLHALKHCAVVASVDALRKYIMYKHNIYIYIHIYAYVYYEYTY